MTTESTRPRTSSTIATAAIHMHAIYERERWVHPREASGSIAPIGRLLGLIIDAVQEETDPDLKRDHRAQRIISTARGVREAVFMGFRDNFPDEIAYVNIEEQGSGTFRCHTVPAIGEVIQDSLVHEATLSREPGRLTTVVPHIIRRTLSDDEVTMLCDRISS